MTPQLITAHYGEMSVLFQADGYINATVIAKQFNKRPNDWLNLASTKEYIACLLEFQLPEKMVIDENQLVIVKKGSPKNGGGTWFHPKLAIAFARWLDARFAVWCDLQIENILRSNIESLDLGVFLRTRSEEPITEADFEWRKEVVLDIVDCLKKTRVAKNTIVLGEELLNF